MKIKSLFINNLLNIENQEFIFPESEVKYFGNLKISILVGENGTCKTSLLKFIAEAFLYPEIGSKYRKYHRHGFKINYSIKGKDNLLEVKHPSEDSLKSSIKKTVPLTFPSNIIVSTTALNGKFSSNSTEVTNTRYIYTGPLKSERATIVKALRDRDLKNQIKKLLKLVGYTDEYRIIIPDDEILQKRIERNKHKIKFLDDISLKKFLNKHKEIGSVHDNSKRKRVVYHNQIDSDWIESIERILEAGVNLDFELELMNSAHNDWINFRDMSSGEQAIFDRFFSLLTIIQDDSLVLIDEPETHLHPRWLKQYVYMLSELFSDINAHFLIATHSPLIAAEVPNECIVGLVKCPETGRIKQYNVSKSTLGGNPNNILNDVFKLNSETGSFSNLIIERIKININNGDIEKALDMFNDLGTTINKYSLYNELKEQIPEEYK